MFRVEWYMDGDVVREERISGTLDEAYDYAEVNGELYDGYTVSRIGMTVTVY